MKIYLAGKIKKYDWRRTIVDNLECLSPDLQGWDELEESPGAFPIGRKLIFAEHDYCGPYFVSCDHGCYHGENSHGVGMEDSSFSHDSLWYPGCMGPQIGGDGPRTMIPENLIRTEIATMCLNSIDNADLVFAWIDSPDCYGTITELGYAFAKGKQVWIASPPNNFVSDMWFLINLADRYIHAVHATPSDALVSFLLESDSHPKLVPKTVTTSTKIEAKNNPRLLNQIVY